MHTFIEVLISIALITAIVVLWRASFRKLFTPLKLPKDCTVHTVLRAKGNGEGIEQLLGGLIWLYSTAGLRPTIIIEDHGLDEEGGAVVRLIERDHSDVLVRWQS